jgi:hypothetical protein
MMHFATLLKDKTPWPVVKSSCCHRVAAWAALVAPAGFPRFTVEMRAMVWSGKLLLTFTTLFARRAV